MIQFLLINLWSGPRLAVVHSRIMSRSNSAKTDSIPNIALPLYQNRVITVDKNPAYPVAIQELQEEKACLLVRKSGNRST